MEFQLKQARLENERRRSEREHEMNVLKLLLSSNHERPSTGRGFAPNDNACFGQFYSGMPMYQPSVPMHSSMDNISVSEFQTQMAHLLQPCSGNFLGKKRRRIGY